MAAPAPPRAASPVVPLELRADTGAEAVIVTARVRVDPADPYLCGHFPGNPIYPGVFLLDLLERAVTGVMPPGTRLLEVVSARFTAPARDGAEVVLSARVPSGARERRVEAVFTGDGTTFATIRAVFGPGQPS